MARRWQRIKTVGFRCFSSLGGLALLALPQPALAECLSLKSGPLIYDIEGCTQIQPEKSFDLTKEKYKWIGDLDAAGKKAVLDSYRGSYLKGKVIKSQISQKGLVPQSGVLAGEEIFTYILPSSPQAALQCSALKGQRISAKLVERCCDGNGDVPCLLGTGYLLQEVKVIGTSGSGAGDAVKQKAKKSSDYQQGDKARAANDWKAAALAYERAKSKGELDIAGHVKLGLAYRQLDQCPSAIAPLKYVQEQREKGAVWADDEAIARSGVFLLARCYSKMNQPGAALMILNSYLLESEKYAKEIKESLNHADFGWIHTSREYRDYSKEARKKLSKIKSQP
jgi:hypothetical protein